MAPSEMSVLTFLGDVWLPRPFKSRVRLKGPYIFNLEAPITRHPKPAPGKINLKAERASYSETFGREPIAVCLANNHIADYGRQGFNDTLDALNAAGIGFFGAGTLEDNGHNPLVLDVCGRRIGLMAYVCRSTHPVLAEGAEPGAMPLEMPRIRRDIRTARQQGADTIIVQLHWGEQDVYWPKPQDVKTARGIVELGADLIIGHHAHCIQACEIYRGKRVFYGLGNAIFPDRDVPSYCADDGTPSRRYVATQKYWNKRSLLVEFEPPSGAVHVRPILFDRGRLDEAAAREATPYRSDLGDTSYERRHARGRKWSRLRGALADFIGRPKLPRMKHVRSLLSLLSKNG